MLQLWWYAAAVNHSVICWVFYRQEASRTFAGHEQPVISYTMHAVHYCTHQMQITQVGKMSDNSRCCSRTRRCARRW